MEKFQIEIEDGSVVLSDFSREQNEGSVELYDWQRRAIDFFFTRNKTIFEVTTGAGKTFCSITILKEILEREPKLRCLIVVPKNVILEDTWFKELYNAGFSLRDIGVYYGAVKEFAKITITNMQNLHNIPLECFDIRIFDECFSGNTNVLVYKNDKYINKSIKEIVEQKIKCFVPSFNIQTKKIENKLVINWYQIKEKRKVLDIKLEDGTILTVTPEQLLYTEKGYIQANKLKNNDELLKW